MTSSMTRHKGLQWGPRIVARGLFLVMGRPLRFLYHRTVVWKRKQNGTHGTLWSVDAAIFALFQSAHTIRTCFSSPCACLYFPLHALFPHNV